MRSSLARLTGLTALVLPLIPAAYGQRTRDALPGVVSTSAGRLTVERLATLEFPWGMASLPDRRLLVTEKPGRLRIWENGRLSEPVRGVPAVVYGRTDEEQGGLLDVEADPGFARNR